MVKYPKRTVKTVYVKILHVFGLFRNEVCLFKHGLFLKTVAVTREKKSALKIVYLKI